MRRTSKLRIRARDIEYVDHKDHKQLLDLINSTPRGEAVNLIGHSWGGDQAAVATLKASRRVTLLVTVDPVGRSNKASPAANSGTWVNVLATPSTRDRSDTIASIGGKPADIDYTGLDEQIEVDTNHGDFSGMMQAKTANGQTVEQRVQASFTDTSADEDESEGGGGSAWSMIGTVITGTRCTGRLTCGAGH